MAIIMKHKTALARLSAFLLAAALLSTSCGGGTTAATMHLRKTEGSVEVSDGQDKNITLMDNLGLYSGYQVGTQAKSYAWIDLDSAKLTKMDSDTQVEILKDGKKLEINAISGSLFFNVTEPLEDDEAMDIRASTMVVGIRGTCGWVEETAGQEAKVYILEGAVECSIVDTAGNRVVTEIVSGGERARVFSEGQGSISVDRFTEFEIPPFVKEELVPDKELRENIYERSRLDLSMDTEESNPVLNDDLSGYLGLYDLVKESENTYQPGEQRITAAKISNNGYLFRSEDIQKVFEDGEYISFISRLPDGVEIYSFSQDDSDEMADSVNSGIEGTVAFHVSTDKDLYIKIR